MTPVSPIPASQRARLAATLRWLALATVLALSAGCAMLDISTLDTAIPLERGQIEVSAWESSGVELDESLWDASVSELGISATTGLTFSVGIVDRGELSARLYTSGDKLGTKLSLKYLMGQDGKNYFALIPGGNLVYYYGLEDDLDKRGKLYGTELQILYTHRENRNVAWTAALRGNFSRYLEEFSDSDDIVAENGPYNIFHYGIRGNLELGLSSFKLLPEIGVELFPVSMGEYRLAPIFGVGLSKEF